ncbi:phage tail tape measure protein [Moraxella nasicaprae]|uniref:Phage tail tape measure protein n=1 Tax=Moraxella nasicaprae TaxID=2904122 RepID=A0ABY6F415_9GAMM|nr:phage tail tape measure protein [Moraxella nasicaprae]UXZ04852.1 phage tail tape measure protein [Moraxella nasicaprae]
MATELSIVISASAMIGGAMNAIRTLTGGLDSVRRSSNILGNEQRRLRGEIDRLGGSSAVPALQRQYDRLGRTMQGLRTNAVQQAGIQTRLENNRQARADMQSQVMGLLGAGMTIAAPVKLAIDFESSMADVKKVVDFGDDPIIAKKQFQELSDEILHLSTIRPMSANDIAQIVALGGQSGIARGELMKFADDAVKMGVAFDVSAQQAGQSMAEMRTAFGMNQTQVVELADQINHLGNNTPAAAKSIMEIVQRVGAFGEVAGSSAGAIAAVGATIRGMGVADEVAATGIKNMFLALGKGENATKGQKAAWEKLGLDHEQIAKDMQTNAEETTLKVLESISKLEKHEQGQVLESLFGSESLLAIAPLLSQLGTLKDNLKKVGDSSQYAGSMNKEYEARAQTTANNLQTLKNQMVMLGISVGSVVLPALNGLINDIKPVIESVIAFTKANPELIATLFKVVTALFAFKAGSLAVRFGFNLLFGGLLSGYGVVARFMGAFRLVNASIRLFQMGRAVSALRLFGLSARQARTAISLFTGGFKLIRSGATGFVSVLGKIMNFAKLFGSSLFSVGAKVGQAFMMIGRVMAVVGRAMLTNPIILIAAVIAGVAYLIYKNWDTIKPMLVAFWTSITQAASDAWQWLVGIWNGFTAWFSSLWNGVSSWIGGVWTGIVNGASIAWQWLIGIWSGFTAWFSSLWTGITAWVSGVWTGIVNGATAAWQWLVGIWSGASAWFGGLWQSVLSVVMSVWSGITSFLSGVWANIRGLVSAGVQGLMAIIRGFSPISAFSTAFSAVWGFLSGLVGRFRTFGVNIIQGLIGGIKSMAGAVVGAISSTVGNVAGTAKRMLGINSPSRVFRQLGSWVSEGLAIGIDKGGQKPVSAIGSVASGVTANFGAKMGNLSAQISTSVGEHQARMTNANATNAYNSNNQQQGNITIHFNPTINTSGGDVGKIERALQISQAEFEKLFNRMQADRQRRAY